jgi:hypothetical protein
MSTVDEIEAAISNLAHPDFARLRDWLLERDHSLWDKQIEEDSSSGKLDHLVQEIEGDIAAGNVKSLNEVINGS